MITDKKYINLEHYILNKMKWKVTLQKEDEWCVVQCPRLPGCVSQGKTKEEALANIKEAIQGYIESLKKDGEDIPPTEEVVEVYA